MVLLAWPLVFWSVNSIGAFLSFFLSPCSSFCIPPVYLLEPCQRGGKTWFAFKAKSFDIEVEVKKGLRGCIWERRKGITSWIKFGGRSLTRLLMGLEACGRASSVSGWGNVWEEEGRRYKMEKGSNQAGVFIRCLVRDSGGKSYNLMFPEGKGVVGGWRILAKNCAS